MRVYLVALFMFCLNIGLAYFSTGGGGAILGSAFPGCGIVNNTYTCGDPNYVNNSHVNLPYDPTLVNYTGEHKDLNASSIDVQGITTGVISIISIIGKSIYTPWLFTSAPFYMPLDLAFYLSAGIWFIYIVGIAQLIANRALKFYK